MKKNWLKIEDCVIQQSDSDQMWKDWEAQKEALFNEPLDEGLANILKSLADK